MTEKLLKEFKTTALMNPKSIKDVLYIKPACNPLSSIVALWEIAGQWFSVVCVYRT